MIGLGNVALRPLGTSGLRTRLASTPIRSRRAQLAVRPAALSLPDSYGYVMATVSVTALMTQWMAVRVVLARKECGVKYPAMYAEGTDELATKFNCTQRAHQNTLEYLPQVLALVVLLGLQYPVYAAGLGMAWNVGRVVYVLGYSTGDPAKRAPGSALAGIVYLVLMASTLYVGGRLALGM